LQVFFKKSNKTRLTFVYFYNALFFFFKLDLFFSKSNFHNNLERHQESV